MSNILDIEREREELIRSISLPGSHRKRLLLLKNFFDIVFNSKNELIKQSYLLEFIDLYCECLKKYNSFYLNPQLTEDILTQIDALSKYNFLSEQFENLQISQNRIREKLDDLNKILNGKEENGETSKLLFPVLEVQNHCNINYTLGILDSITIEVSKAQISDKFLIIPSETDVEERLKRQIENSWNVAINYISKLVRRKHKFHKVIIQFVERIGYYVGGSLGVTLAIGFIEKLLEYYNSPYLVNIKSCIATTGGLETAGSIQRTGDDIIKSKVEIVFYSNVNTFVIPYADETAAEQKLSELNEQYPNRNLKIVPVKDLNDLLDRRSIIEIKKQNPVVRTAKNVKRHYGVSLLLLFIILLLSWFYIREYDDNPWILENEGNALLVKNKSGKLLWEKEVGGYAQNYKDENYLRLFQLLEDVNNDGMNEIILADRQLPDSLKKYAGRIACFNCEGKLIWQYLFRDTVRTKYEALSQNYLSNLIGILDKGSNKEIVCIAHNDNSFSSAVFKLDAETGKRLEGTLWNPGHIISGFIMTTKLEKEPDLICQFCNNSYEQTGIFIIPYNKLEGTGPYKKEEYHLIGKSIAEFKSYILVPNTDYNKYSKLRNNSPLNGGLYYNHTISKIVFGSCEDNNYNEAIAGYKLNSNLKDFEITINNQFRVRRDTLVAHGILKQPYTDTKAYCDLLKSQILYWNGKDFVKREELK